jgi:N-acetylmuramoyl-L-alanine amidase
VGGTKACNTVGAATDSGYPETTFNFAVASLTATRLRGLGARVVLSRSADSAALWGPCVDVRGRLGNSLAGTPTAVKVSIHADGGPASAAGFHVITSPSSPGSRALAREMKESLASSFPVATYVADGTGLDSRTDLATLNHSRIPTVLVELGNMRNDSDAGRMTTASGRTAYAEALVDGILAWAE